MSGDVESDGGGIGVTDGTWLLAVDEFLAQSTELDGLMEEADNGNSSFHVVWALRSVLSILKIQKNKWLY